jgi:hypothetical protein
VRAVKIGVLAALIVVTGLALLWMTEAIPRADVREMTPKALGAVLVLVLASLAWSAVRGNPAGRDDTDKPVP